jgi:glycosyltransferase involved in cell wall biosynthesis
MGLAMIVVLDTRVVTGTGGGPDKTILNSPRFFAGSGYRMLCAYMHPPGDPGFDQLRAKAHAWQAPLSSIEDRGPWDWRVIAQLVSICRRERVRIWHGHDYKSNALGLIVRQFWPMRLVTTVHGWVKHTGRTPLYYAIDKFCLPRYETVICVSPDLREECLTVGVTPSRCVVIKNGIDTEEFARRLTKQDAKHRLGFRADRMLIGTVGRLSPEKGFGRLFEAVQDLLTRGFDVELAIAGNGSEMPNLKAQCATLGIADRVRFLGYQRDPRPFYEALDLFALSSLREGLPNVLLEAMSMEVPVVATRVGGVTQLVNDGDNGLVIAPDSPVELSKALQQLIRDDALQARFRKNGRATVEARFSFAERIQKLKTVYDSLLKAEHAQKVDVARTFLSVPAQAGMPVPR